MHPKIIIVGGGFGGIEVAKKLKNADVEILMLDRLNHHTFQPLLYQVATGSLDAPSVAFPLRKMFRKQKNFNFRIADVKKINPAQRTIETDIGDFEYNILVLATGATTNFFGNEDLEYFTLPMKNLKEAVQIRSFLLQNIEASILEKDPEKRPPFLNFVVVGGGPTGVELSGAIAEIRNHILTKDYPELSREEMNVFLIEGQPRVLANLSPQASEKAGEYLQKLGVKLRLDTQVTGYDGETITLGDDQNIPSKMVIWSAGVKGQLPGGIDPAEIVRGNRVKIRPDCRLAQHDDIFAIGDMAAMITEKTPNGHPGVAPAAQQQGRFVGRQIQRLIKGEALESFQYYDKGSMATVGRNKAVVDMGKIRFQGFFAWWIWMFVHLMSLVGFRNRAVTFINWTISYITFNGGIRLIINPYERKPRKPKSEATSE